MELALLDCATNKLVLSPMNDKVEVFYFSTFDSSTHESDELTLSFKVGPFSEQLNRFVQIGELHICESNQSFSIRPNGKLWRIDLDLSNQSHSLLSVKLDMCAIAAFADSLKRQSSVWKKDCYSVAFNSMFREYDVRGHVSDEELNDTNVYRIVKAYGYYLEGHGIKRAIVGYDNRKCSPGFADASIKALTELGIDVVFVGLSLSPVVYYAQYRYKCEGACMITASHNPSDWSGFKFANGYSKTLESGDIRELYELLDYQDDVTRVPGSVTVCDVRDDYINEILSRVHMGPNLPRLVIDAGNGGAGVFAYELFQRLGCMTFQLHCDPDDNYPNYFPNPSDIQSRTRMKQMILHPYVHADLGISFDGDGDRIGVIDNKGENIWSDVILAVLAKQLLTNKKGAKVVFDVKCSQTLTEVVESNGGIPIMWKTGHSYIKAKMHEINAELAGERSGHIFVGGDDYFGFDDALFVAAKLVEFLSNQEKTISEIVDEFPKYITSPEIKAYCADDVKYVVVEEIVEAFKKAYPGRVNDINGARVQFDHGWGLIRASSNLPELVIIFEADTMEHLLEIRAVLKEMTSKYKEISKDWENDNY